MLVQQQNDRRKAEQRTNLDDRLGRVRLTDKLTKEPGFIQSNVPRGDDSSCDLEVAKRDCPVPGNELAVFGRLRGSDKGNLNARGRENSVDKPGTRLRKLAKSHQTPN